MNPQAENPAIVLDELQLLAELLALEDRRVIELGCGAAQLARSLLTQYPNSTVCGLELDRVQHAKNLAQLRPGLSFMFAGAEAIPFPDASFDLALMLKSLHHVPQALLPQALQELGRVLSPGGFLYVSEPVFDGPLNEVIRVFNDEQLVRAAAQAALDLALLQGPWEQTAERHFVTPVHFHDFAEFEQRMMRPSYADHHLDQHKLDLTRQRFDRHLGPDGAQFLRPIHVRLLRRLPTP